MRLGRSRARGVNGAGAGEDGEAVVFEPAVGVGEAGFAHPVELVFDGGAAVVLLAVEGVGDLLRGGAAFADLLEPEGFVDGVEGGGGAGDLLGVDEDAAGAEGGKILAKRARLASWSMWWMERAETMESYVPLMRRGGVVGDLEGDVGVAGEALAGLGEHGLGEVGEDDVGAGVPLADELREEAGAGAEVEDVLRVGGDEVGGAAVEGVVAGDELGAVGVVGGGGDVEDGLGVWTWKTSGVQDTAVRVTCA